MQLAGQRWLLHAVCQTLLSSASFLHHRCVAPFCGVEANGPFWSRSTQGRSSVCYIGTSDPDAQVVIIRRRAQRPCPVFTILTPRSTFPHSKATKHLTLLDRCPIKPGSSDLIWTSLPCCRPSRPCPVKVNGLKQIFHTLGP
jgi:hypothetical protein